MAELTKKQKKQINEMLRERTYSKGMTRIIAKSIGKHSAEAYMDDLGIPSKKKLKKMIKKAVKRYVYQFMDEVFLSSSEKKDENGENEHIFGKVVLPQSGRIVMVKNPEELIELIMYQMQGSVSSRPCKDGCSKFKGESDHPTDPTPEPENIDNHSKKDAADDEEPDDEENRKCEYVEKNEEEKDGNLLDKEIAND